MIICRRSISFWNISNKLLVDLLDSESSLLSGYSIVVSDNINVKGFKTTAGTKALKNYKPTEDAEVIKRLREEGGTVIGKKQK